MFLPGLFLIQMQVTAIPEIIIPAQVVEETVEQAAAADLVEANGAAAAAGLPAMEPRVQRVQTPAVSPLLTVAPVVAPATILLAVLAAAAVHTVTPAVAAAAAGIPAAAVQVKRLPKARVVVAPAFNRQT
jgi:hypothetical protein